MLNYYKKYEVETLVMGYIGFKVPSFFGCHCPWSPLWIFKAHFLLLLRS